MGTKIYTITDMMNWAILKTWFWEIMIGWGHHNFVNEMILNIVHQSNKQGKFA